MASFSGYTIVSGTKISNKG